MKMAKASGIVALAMFAALAIATAPASAAEYTSAKAMTTFVGTQGAGQSNKWLIGITTSTCGKAKYESAVTATPAKIITKVDPQWSECTNFGFSEEQSTTETGGCKFELLQPNVSLESNVAIRCSAGENIRLFAGSFFSTCEVLIGEAGNTNLLKMQYKNIGGTPTRFETRFEITGITAEIKKSSGFCGLTKGIIKNASFNAQVNIEGEGGVNVSVG